MQRVGVHSNLVQKQLEDAFITPAMFAATCSFASVSAAHSNHWQMANDMGCQSDAHNANKVGLRCKTFDVVRQRLM